MSPLPHAMGRTGSPKPGGPRRLSLWTTSPPTHSRGDKLTRLGKGMFSNRFLSATLLLLFGVLVVVLGSPLLVGKVHVGDDLGNVHLPIRSLYQEALRSGHSVLWSPHL